ncbi:cobalamin biosynthesis protein CobD [bacterium]|nr:cobalamin biosynthesis protein CobD [bacterium]
MRLEIQILAAVALDLLLGDPRWLPHPVRGIGWLALKFESITRRVLRPRVAGMVTAVSVVAAAGGIAWGLLAAARAAHPIAGDVVAILVIYTTLAARDLARHSMAVYEPLATGDLPEARRRVAMIVGRDTADLDEQAVARAAVESVAESIVDGVTAPLLLAALLGPVGAMVYRAINTLDSTFGYKNERYREFGWASARLDDVANAIPARLTAPLLCLASLRRESVRILRRDGRNHASPNSGLTEAAMAGALGIQLGGPSTYGGVPVDKPTLGDATRPIESDDIRKANALMFATEGLFLALTLGALLLWRTMP